MAANTPPGNAAPLGRLAVELLEHVKFFLEDSVRDMVALDYALYGKNIGQKMSMDYKELAVKHSRNLLMTAALCQQISYDGNDKAKWDKMRLRPSPWTNLPTDHTYLTMIRIERYRPQHDLRGNPISLQDIKRFYEEEQMEERRRLVFQTRVQRSGGGYPSPESREKIGMADADARRYSELLQHATPGTAEYRIIMECMEDEERARQDRVGQHAAFRRLFYKVVTDPEIQPGVCMSCLAPNAAAWILVRKTGNITVRFCEGCTLPFARARQVTLIGMFRDTIYAFKVFYAGF